MLIPSILNPLLALYIFIGPLAWVALAFAMIKGRQRMRILRGGEGEFPDPLPAVSVLVPAKDEQEQIAACIGSIQRLDYPALQIIAIDDRSSDRTGAILDGMAQADPRIRVFHIRDDELPRGWGGKNFALHRGVEGATGSWLLFVDADVTLQPQALAAALRLAYLRRFDMVSLLPRFDARTFWEALMQPLGGAATSCMFLIALTNYNEVRTAFANGQFMLVRRGAYDAVGGHDAVRGLLSEDTALARRLKDAGFRPRLAWGEQLASVRMFDSFRALFHGWARNFYIGTRGTPWRILAAVAFVLICCMSAYIALGLGIASHSMSWTIASIAHLLVMTGAIAMAYRWNRSPPWYALLLPLGLAVLLAIFIRALIICATGRVEWRGTTYARSDLQPARGS